MSGWGNGNGLAGFVGGGRGEFDTLSARPASSTGFSYFFFRTSFQGNQLFPMTFTLDTFVEIYNLCLFDNSYNSYRNDSQCSVVGKKLSDEFGYKLRPFHERM